MRRAAWLAALTVAALGCGAPSRAVRVAPPRAEEELVAMLPSGMEGVAAIDLAQLRAWPAGGALIARFVDAVAWGSILDGANEIAVGWVGSAERSTVIIVAQGAIDLGAARAALGAEVEVERYRGVELWHRSGNAVAELAPGTVAAGPWTEVRRAIDLLGRRDRSVRDDESLMGILRRAPEPHRGRAAFLLASYLSPVLQDRLAVAGVEGGAIQSISAALAIGDGFDLGIVATTDSATAALRLEELMRDEIERWRRRPALRVTGLSSLIAAVRFGRRESELHLALRLDAEAVERLRRGVARLEQLTER